MTTEVAIRQGMTLSDKITYAKALAESNLLPTQYRKNPANLLFALEYAEALGVAPIHAITSIHVIEGKPSASADLIGTMVRRAGHRLRVTGDDTQAVAQIIRADDPDFTFEARWDMNRARAAGLANKGVWKSYPGAMLRSRAITDVARAAAPDALYGVIYTPEELGAQVDGEGAVMSPQATQAAPPASAADRVRANLRPALEPQLVPDLSTITVEHHMVVDTATGEHKVVEAEVVPEEPAMATRPQLVAINAAMGALFGFESRDDKLAYLSGELGRDIASSSELTKDEASQLIDKLSKAQAEEDAGRIPDEPAEAGAR